MRLLLAALAAALTSCSITADYGGTRFRCTNNECPDGQTCVAGFCEAGGATTDAAADAVALTPKMRTMTFDNRTGPALLDFPVAIRFDETTVDYAAFTPDGSDVHFADSDGTPLPHELERWDPAGESVFWVQVPQIDAGSATDGITMLYGDPLDAMPEQPAVVFSDYLAVYHLGDDASDSSPSGFDGTDVASSIVSAQIGNGRSFSSIAQYIDLGTDRPFLRAQPAFTISAWVRVDPLAVNGVFFATSIDNMGMPTNTSRGQLLMNTAGELEGDVRTQEGGAITRILGPILPRDTWIHTAFVADLAGDQLELFLDGVSVAVLGALLIDPATADSVSTQTVIGIGENFTVDSFLGQVDEVRLAPAALSTDRINADFRSGLDVFVTVGPEQPR